MCQHGMTCNLALQVRLAAIPSPVNMLNLQAGGYWETIRARMVQAERHARGCADFAYCLKHARSMPHFSWRTVALCLKVGLPVLRPLQEGALPQKHDIYRFRFKPIHA